jgi:hypothetical protein
MHLIPVLLLVLRGRYLSVSAWCGEESEKGEIPDECSSRLNRHADRQKGQPASEKGRDLKRGTISHAIRYVYRNHGRDQRLEVNTVASPTKSRDTKNS